MTFTDAASDSKTMARAMRDLREGFGKRELWLHLGWQDIKQRYRRSVLGPFWITIATGTTAVAMGLLYSKLFKLPLEEHLPYVTLGLIIWNLSLLPNRRRRIHSRSPAGSRRDTRKYQPNRTHSWGRSLRNPGWDSR